MRPILVVDDDQDIRDTVVEVLQDEGFAALGATGGAAALEMLRAAGEKPCFILLDLRMPGMSGEDFRREQLKDPALAGIPIVLLSADSHVDARAAELGAAACLKKPLTLEALVAVARRFAA